MSFKISLQEETLSMAKKSLEAVSFDVKEKQAQVLSFEKDINLLTETSQKFEIRIDDLKKDCDYKEYSLMI